MAGVSARFLKCSSVKGSNLVPLSLFYASEMSSAPPASRLSSLTVTDDFDEQGERPPSSPNGERKPTDPVHFTERDLESNRSITRPFCTRCEKAAVLCICRHVKTVVENKTSIIILQHPEEKRHHLGSARIALLGLQNVQIINVSEADAPVSHRMREKVPGSKRSIAGRGGKKAQSVKEETLPNKKLLPKSLPAVTSHSEQQWPDPSGGESALPESDSARADYQFAQWSTVPPWINLQPDVGLLFPSGKAIDLWPTGLGLITESSDSELTFECQVGNASSTDSEGKRVHRNSPSQLIVLDGTWSKAKRIFFENPWLHSLPHYRLPTLQESRYGRLRREPKPGFLSTVESIVYALQLLEPETHGLESLLGVFDSMIKDQMRVAAENIKGRYEALD